MAYYKLFPTKDTTLYSEKPTLNAGLDPILEVSNNINASNTPVVTRNLIQFDNDEITNIIGNIINGKSHNIYLKQFISLSTGMNFNTYLNIHPIAQDWNNGTGRTDDTPIITDGACWDSPEYINSIPWSGSGSIGGYNFTSSYNSSYANQGGGNWFTTASLTVTQSFSIRSKKDIEVDVTNTVTSWYNNDVPNNGFITKLPDTIEFTPSSSIQPEFKFYSVDTNTIYPPYLEFRWDDYSTVLTGSASNYILTQNPVKVSINENKSEFHYSSINRFRINSNALYPTRTFQTSSLYTSLNYLPTSSYYAVKDLATNEYIIDFDTTYTKISSDSKGNYFDIYMSGLEPERYYCILIKTTIDGSTMILDNDYYFKVIN